MSDVSDDEAMPEWNEDELALLRSADRDRPGTRSLPATLAAVGAAGAVATSAAGAHGAAAVAVATAAKTTAGMVIAKWIVVATLGGALVAGGVALSKRGATVKAPRAERSRAPASPPAQQVPAAALVPVEPQAPSPASAAPARARKPAVASSPAHKHPIVLQPDIRLEISSLDTARSKLRAGDARAALAALDRYDADYGKAGALRIEATALRIEALLRAGQHAEASVLAEGFLSSHPQSPYAARVRTLLGPAPARTVAK